MIRKVLAIGLAAGLWLGTLPVGVSAKGFGVHASHAVGLASFEASPADHYHHKFWHDRYGSLAVIDHPDVAAAPLQADTSNASGCSHSRVTKTVPSEEGGTREITITRC